MNDRLLAASVDFETTGSTTVADAAELADLLRDHAARAAPVRLCGTGTRQRELPAPSRPPLLVSLGAMAKITRLEPDDLTCSAEPGVLREHLDAALHDVGLRLPCAPSAGTVGGLFALGRESSPEAPGALASLGARALLLGLSGLLAEGRSFKAGARVVKSVAGFDLHKLFVGSRGRLFAATELHLKLRPLPRAAAAFAIHGLEAPRALEQFRALRLDDAPPAAVRLMRTAGAATFTVSGRFEGAGRVVADRMRAHGLEESGLEERDVGAAPTLERLIGLIAPRRLRELLELLPQDAPLRISGTGTFEVFVTPDEADELLRRLPECGAAAELDLAPPGRRGRATLTDPGAVALQERLKAALDPNDVLT